MFDNGLPLGPTSWIDRGRLDSLIQTRYTAGLTGLPVTPPIDNLIFEQDGATASLDDLITGTERGLLVTCLWYIREVDPQTLLLTGLTRDGVYLVEGGEVVGAVNNFRFNESPVDLLSRITDVGATVRCLPREWNDYFSRTAMPPVKVTDFNMSTVSQASRWTRVGRSDVLEPEPDFHGDLEVLDVTLDDVAPDLGHLEPVEVPDGFGRPPHAVAHRLLDAVARGADDFGDPVGAVAHVFLHCSPPTFDCRPPRLDADHRGHHGGVT